MQKDGEETGQSWWRGLLSLLGRYAWLILLIIALRVLYREWGGFHLRDLHKALSEIGGIHITYALAFTLLSLIFNASLDLVAMRWLGRSLPKGEVLGTAFLAGSFAMNGGGTVLGGGSIRLRFYGQCGLSGAEVARITGYLMVVGWLGHSVLAGTLLLISPPELPWLSAAAGRGIGAALLGISVVAFALSTVRKPIRWLSAVMPRWRILSVAVLLSTMDWLCAGLALRMLMPEGVSTIPLLAATAVGQALGAASHVPGGMGVIELSISKLSEGMIAAPAMAGALLTYRLTYYLIPFLIAITLVAIREIWAKQSLAQVAAGSVVKVWATLAPRIASMGALVGGFVLMLSASTPIEQGRRVLLERLLPLPFVEASHFLSSIAGTLMIVVAHGLLRRVAMAWWIAVAMAAGGIVFSLLKGFDWEEAIILSIFLAALLPVRQQFYRHAALLSRRFTPQWWALIIGMVAIILWVGFYASRHVGYDTELWWRASFSDDTSRFLRALAISLIIIFFIALLQWLRPAPPRSSGMTPNLEIIASMVASSPNSSSALALLGDKKFLFNYDQSAFMMFGDQGRTRVGLGDPVGNPEKFEGLYWRFVEQAHDEGMRPVLYQVRAPLVPACVEIGLHVFKLGEEALVNLTKFDLNKPDFRKFRSAAKRIEREEWQFEIWEPSQGSAHLSELRIISDAWLQTRNAREKGFSLGWFDEDYLSRVPVAVIRVAGRVTSFANLWPSDGKEELSIDLMRHIPDAPNGTMDALMIRLMLWAQERGYLWFNLGMAPLSGLELNRPGPVWNRMGRLIYDHGERFYNFTGLRAWKEKFHPEWRPRYLAVAKIWDVPAALLDVTRLIGRKPEEKKPTDSGVIPGPDRSDAPEPAE